MTEHLRCDVNTIKTVGVLELATVARCCPCLLVRNCLERHQEKWRTLLSPTIAAMTDVVVARLGTFTRRFTSGPSAG